MKIIILSVLVLSASYFAGQWLRRDLPVEKKTFSYRTSCNPLKNACEFIQSKKNYRLEFTGKPSSLVPFSVIITSDKLSPQTIDISFEMQAMEMGLSDFQMRYITAEGQKPLWRAKVLLPVCSLGRNDWRLNVKIRSNNELHVTEFGFELP